MRNFLLPQPDLFGFCDNYKSAEFLRTVSPDTTGSCVQQILDLEQAAQGSLSMATYLRSYLLGSDLGSDSAQI